MDRSVVSPAFSSNSEACSTLRFELPREIWIAILRSFSSPFTISLSTVCRYWRELTVESVTNFECCDHAKISDDLLRRFINVDSIRLVPFCGVTGTGLLAMPKLRSLVVAMCQNSECYAGSLSLLTALTLLHVSRASFLSNEGLRCLTNLTSLNITHNFCYDDAGLLPLRNLTHLNLTRAQCVSDEVLLALPDLLSLVISDTTLVTCRGVQSLMNLTSLVLLNEGMTSAAIKGLTKLRSLKLAAGDLISSAALSDLTNLTKLDLHDGGWLSDEVFSGKTKLHTVRLKRCDCITANGLRMLTNVTELSLCGHKPTNDPYSVSDAMIGLTNLTCLRLGAGAIVRSAVLNQLTNLVTLVFKNDSVSRDGDAFSTLPKLTTLSLKMSHVPEKAVKRLTNLTWLSLNSDTHITDDGITNLTNLTKLDLSGNALISHNALANLPKLKFLNIFNNTFLTGELKSSLPNLVLCCVRWSA